MQRETNGTVISAARQWWRKINTKPVRMSGADGAIYPHVLKVRYTVDGAEYIKRKWLSARSPVPAVGSSVRVVYDENKPSKASVLL